MGAWLMTQGSLAAAETALARIERTLIEDSQVTQVSSDYVMEFLLAPALREKPETLADDERRTLLFDVRESDEFAVSHLPGAIWLDPDTSAAQFVREYGWRLGGSMPIFYCSVGKRSNAFAEAVAAHTSAQTSPVIPMNLRGGIFRWHNEEKPLVDAHGATDKVHPYSWYWRRLLEHPERSAYEPTVSVITTDPVNR